MVFGGKTVISGVFFDPLVVNVSEEDLVGVAQGAPLNLALFSVLLEVVTK